MLCLSEGCRVFQDLLFHLGFYISQKPRNYRKHFLSSELPLKLSSVPRTRVILLGPPHTISPDGFCSISSLQCW